MTMACYDMVTVDILSATFQTSQLGEVLGDNCRCAPQV
jgi:hypothetical protein